MTDELKKQDGEEQPFTLTAYHVKKKQRNVPILNAVITRTKKGAYMAQGDDGEGNKLVTLMGEEKAKKAVELGLATKEGW